MKDLGTLKEKRDIAGYSVAGISLFFLILCQTSNYWQSSVPILRVLDARSMPILHKIAELLKKKNRLNPLIMYVIPDYICASIPLIVISIYFIYGEAGPNTSCESVV